jgi:NMD protein affecting ribosome stability and mRNA decay
MRDKKRYSNVTFTKRVDHEAGRHHTPRAPSELEKCESCGAVYFKRRWVLAGTMPQLAVRKREHPTKLTLCPACKRQQEGLPAGFVYLEGVFIQSHRDQIEGLLRNEAERAMEDNPLGRIMNLQEDSDGRLVVRTTTEHLAERLGQALEKAFSGEVRYDFSHENKLARVYWRRD